MFLAFRSLTVSTSCCSTALKATGSSDRFAGHPQYKSHSQSFLTHNIKERLALYNYWQNVAGSPSGGGDDAAYVFDIKQVSWSIPFYSALVSMYLSMALSTVFHSINSPDSSPLSHSVLPVLFLPHWSFQLYISV